MAIDYNVRQFSIAMELSLQAALQKLNKPFSSPVALHLASLQHFRQCWGSIFSNQTCFSCLCRKPEHAFKCGHTICDVYFRRFGIRSLRSPLSYNLRGCIYCGTSGHIEAKFKPPTAGLRMLSLDGGGSRVVISLLLLTSLMLRMEMGIGDMKYVFDMIGETSAGKLLRYLTPDLPC